MRTPAPQVQRQTEEEEVQAKPITPLVQRQSEDEDEKVQMLQRQSEEEDEKVQMLQRQAEEDEKVQMLQRQSEDEDEKVQMLQRQSEDEDEKVQAKAVSSQTPALSPHLESKIQSRRGTGQPLPKSTRAFMEPRFGYDFSSVRLHTDSHAASAASELNAQAFTTGQDIFFGSGHYEPHTTKGKSLLAHELTHTIQQQPSTARMLVQRRDGMNGNEPVTSSPTSLVQAPPSRTPATSLPVQEPPSPTPATSLPVPAPPSPTPGSPPATATQAPEGTIPATSPEASVAPPVEMMEETTESVSAEAPQESTTPQPMGETSAVGVELLMPEPPSELSQEAQSRLEQVQSNAAGAAVAESELPDAEANVASARGAVTEPEAETSARAGEALVEALGERPQPSPEIEALCQRIYQAIRSKRPPDEESLVDADPTEAAQEAGGELNQSIQSNIEQVESSYDQLDQQPEGTPQQQPQELEVPPETVETPEIGAEAAVPDPVAPEAVSLDADVAASGTRMEEAGMNTEAAQLVETGPIAEARAAQGELQETAQRDPAEVLAEQQEALANASSDMAALQEAALNALATSRASTVGGVHSQQTEMVGSEEQMRTQISAQAQGIFAHAQNQVNTLLTPLSQTAMNRWETGVAVLSGQFRQRLSRVKRWVDERHESTLLAVVDYLTGLPDWVTEEYDEAEQAFGDGVCNLIREISAEVNGVIATCEALIDQARQEINNLFTNLPAELQEWAASEQERFNAQLDGLHQQVMSTRDNFNSDLANRAAQSVQEVRQEIHQLREAAGGLIGRVVNAVNQFLEDPAKFIIEGLLALVGIAASAFWAVVNRIGDVIGDIADNPLGFAENLLAAIGQGFAQFFDNIGSYLLDGLLEWLFSGMGAVGVQIPSDFSLSSVITFFLELMGITWERIRGLLARHIGEENIALIEQAYELIADLITMGPQGIFEMIKEQLDPQNILDMVMQSAIDFLTETLIAQVSVRVLAMFNPVGAIAQAIEVIYKVLKWIFENAARIFSLVETVVNGMADIIAGNVSGMANAVEQSLARLLVPVIDFFAGLIGLGNLPDRVADTIRGFQEWVESILERVIAWLVERARALLRSLGLSGDAEIEQEGESQSGDGEVGKTINFAAGGESHRLWLNVQGTDVIVMVASEAEDVAAKLNEWQGQIDELSDNQKSNARSLLSSARQRLGIAEEEGQEAVEEKREAEQNPENQSAVAEFTQADDQAEQAEQSLAEILKSLFELFGGDPTEKLAEIAEALPSHAEQYTEKVHRSWYDKQITKVKLGAEENSPALWNSNVLNNTETEAFAFTRNSAVHQQLLPYFITSPGERRANTTAFYSYAFVNGDVEHSVRGDFLNKLGYPTINSLKSTGISRVDYNNEVGEDYKQKLKGKIEKIDYDVSINPYGRFDLPTERIPDHSRFKPLDIKPTPNGIKYRTEAGQDFEVSINPGEFKHTIEGLGLQMMSGRGVTQDSPWFSKNNGFNRAHLIANEFGGSGFANGQNLATTSDYYNKVEMRNAEVTIGQSIRDFAEKNGVSVNDVRFDLRVDITFGNLADPDILQEIEKQDWFPKDSSIQTLEKEIKQKIKNGEVSKNLMRVLEVMYSWKAYIPGGLEDSEQTTLLGPDYRILTEKAKV
ncbi:MAG: DUF4157 domain-containing protein [Okeania sp. SIO2C2]|nr:DUF4157 domain-containing protein [Okeania sp. SIO2C2]